MRLPFNKGLLPGRFRWTGYEFLQYLTLRKESLERVRCVDHAISISLYTKDTIVLNTKYRQPIENYIPIVYNHKQHLSKKHKKHLQTFQLAGAKVYAAVIFNCPPIAQQPAIMRSSH